jgi:dTDP-glucose 4,6-dehydratase
MRVTAKELTGSWNLRSQRGAKFLYASTSEVYGDALVHPQSESYCCNVSIVGARSVHDEGEFSARMRD